MLLASHHHPAARRADRDRHLPLRPAADVDRPEDPPGHARMSTAADRSRRTARRSRAEEKVAVASQLQLTWWRFRRHRLAVWSGVVVLAVLSGRDLRRLPRHHRSARHRCQAQLHPAAGDPLVRREAGSRRMSSGSRACAIRAPSSWSTPRIRARSAISACSCAAIGYSLLRLFPTDRHLLGVTNGRPQDGLFLLGTDLLGRDVWSRLLLASRPR